MAEKGRIEGLIEAGKVWSASAFLNAIGVGADAFILVRTPGIGVAPGVVALDYQVSPLYQSSVYLYEAPDISADGTPLTPYNMRRDFAGSPTAVEVFSAPTIGGGGNGTQLEVHTVPNATSFAGIHGGIFDPDREWLLKPGEDYLIRVENTSSIASWAFVNTTWTEKVVN